VHELNGVEIFRTGIWHGRRYEAADLDALAAHFAALALVWRPPLKLGHGDDQRLAELLGLPGVGEVARVWRADDRLLADFVNIPDAVFWALVERRYRVSAEIHPRLRVTVPGEAAPRVLRLVLRAVALVLVPAIKDLRVWAGLHFGDLSPLPPLQPVERGSEVPTAQAGAVSEEKSGGVSMGTKVRQFFGLLRELVGLPGAEAYDEGPALLAGDAERPMADQPAAMTEEGASEDDAAIAARIEAWTAEGLLRPAAAPPALALLRAQAAQPVQFEEGGAAVSVADAFEQVLRANGPVVDYGEKGRALEFPAGELSAQHAERYAQRVLRND